MKGSAKELAELLGITVRSVRRKAELEGWAFKEVKANGGKVKIYTMPKVNKEAKEEPKLCLDDFSLRERERALMRFKLVDAYVCSGLSQESFWVAYTSGELERDLLAELGAVSLSSLKRWSSAYTKSGLVGLCSSYKNCGSSKLSDDAKELLRARWLILSKPNVREVVRQIQEIDGLEISESQARYYLKSIPKADVLYFRFGKKKFNDKIAYHAQRDYTQIASMQWVSADHKTLDFLINDGNGKAVRYYLTAITDFRSRKVLGWCISESASGLSILAALEMMVKEHGLPENILTDNGRDFKSRIMLGDEHSEGLLKELGCNVQHSLPYNGKSKPVERFFNTVNNFERSFSSYTGSNTVTRAEEQKAYFGRFQGVKLEVKTSAEDVRKAFGTWVRKWNAEHKHTGQGMNGRTPDSVFKAHLDTKRVLRMGEDYHRLIFSEKKTLKVGRRDFSWDGLNYQMQDLEFSLKSTGEYLMLRRPLSDVSTAYVYSLDGRYLGDAVCVNFLANRFIAGVSAWELKRVKRKQEMERKAMKKAGWSLGAIQSRLKSVEQYLIHEADTQEEMREESGVENVSLQVVGGDFQLPTKRKAKLEQPKKSKIIDIF